MTALEGKVAVVLGASAERGTGWAIAEAFAAAGARVVVGARSEAPLKQLAQKIDGTAVVCDACREDDIRLLADTALARYGRLDVAVNAAGAPIQGFVADTTDANLDAALRLNFYAHVHFVKHMAAAMTEGGSIVIVSSLAATHPCFPIFAYGAAKAATECLVRYAAVEYGPRNIRINALQPGPIVSDLGGEILSNPTVVKSFLKEIPLRRLGYPADYANAALWLAGPAYVTGLSIPLCGGLQLERFPHLDEMGGQESWDGQGETLYDRERQRS